MNLLTRLLGTFLSTGLAFAQSGDDPLAALLRARVSADGPGVVAVVVRDGAVLHRAAYGLADTTTKAPLRPDHPFYVASVAKSVTAACIVDLALAGKLKLDDEVLSHLPDLPAHCRGITLRHLMHHRSGLRDFYELELLASRRPGDLTTRGVLELLARQRGTNFAPGSDFLYSNTGYLLLAEVVRKVTGKSLRAFANERLFVPLGMTNTWFRDADHSDARGLPKSYDDGEETPLPPLLCGAGGLCSTADDLQRWIAAIAGSGFRPDLVRELVTPPVLRRDQKRSPQFEPYAGGMLMATLLDEPAVLLLGGFFGWQAAALALPQSKLQIVVLANGDADALGIARNLAATVLGRAESRPESTNGRPGYAIYRADDGEVLLHVTRKSGTEVVTTLSWKVEVVSRDGQLRSVPSGTPLSARVVDGALEVTIGGETPRRYRPLAPQRVEPTVADSLAGTWHGYEIAADVVLLAKDGRLVLDTSRMAMPVAPFMALDRDTWISDTGMQIDVQRDAGGSPIGLRISTARARGMTFVRR
ncbi:MAG: beta-lactamase family protein [Planctomycetes bacterium]|nr:beta-lactamase family protein [Planctomycetota bacterium]